MSVCEYIWINKFPSHADANSPLTSETLPRCMGEHSLSLIATFRVKIGTRFSKRISLEQCYQNCTNSFYKFVNTFDLFDHIFKLFTVSKKQQAMHRIVMQKQIWKLSRINQTEINFLYSIMIQGFYFAFFACHAKSTFAMCRLIFFPSSTRSTLSTNDLIKMKPN